MVSLRQQIGSRIRELRLLKGLTQAELAELMELSTNYIGCIERGERTVSLQNLERFARTLEVEIGAFFLYRGREASRKSKSLDRKAQILTKLATFLQHLEVGDLKLLFKFAKRLVPKDRS